MPVRMPKGKKCAFVYNLDIDGPALWLGGGYGSIGGAPYYSTTGRKTKVVEIPWNYYVDDFPYFDFIFGGTQTGLREPCEVFWHLQGLF